MASRGKPFQTARIVRQFSYGVATCGLCRHMQFFHTQRPNRRKAGNPMEDTDTTMYSLRRFMHEDGWRKSKSHHNRWVCPECAEKLGIAGEAEEAIDGE